VEEVWLFGSLTTEPRHDDFDIDLAVRGLVPERYFEALAHVSDVATEAVDLIPLETVDKHSSSRIAAAGERLDHG
jgi:predicted nucleotidyltransferase